jgi:hypothetical protein
VKLLSPHCNPIRTLRKWLSSVVTFIRHDRVENSDSLPSTGCGLAAQRLPCQLQLLADPDRFRVYHQPLELGQALTVVYYVAQFAVFWAD